jgi:hypothetical protein
VAGPDDIGIVQRGIIKCPAGDAGAAPITFDMAAILRAESREAEVAALTKDKAKELAKHFNWAWREVMQFVAFMRRQRDLAESKVDEVQADLMVNFVSKFLEERGLKDSADTRKAVVALQPAYREAVDRASQIRAVVSYLEVKAKSFERLHHTAYEARNGGWQPSVANPEQGTARPPEEARKPAARDTEDLSSIMGE